MSSTYRAKAIDEHGEECDLCGATEAIEVHHIDGDRTNDALDNLVPLCVKCHSEVHRSGKGGLEEHLLPRRERAVTYNVDVDGELWEEWKNTVPRTKKLGVRIEELIRADLAASKHGYEAAQEVLEDDA